MLSVDSPSFSSFYLKDPNSDAVTFNINGS
jgi:hypothetical protein